MTSVTRVSLTDVRNPTNSALRRECQRDTCGFIHALANVCSLRHTVTCYEKADLSQSTVRKTAPPVNWGALVSPNWDNNYVGPWRSVETLMPSKYSDNGAKYMYAPRVQRMNGVSLGILAGQHTEGVWFLFYPLTSWIYILKGNYFCFHIFCLHCIYQFVPTMLKCI